MGQSHLVKEGEHLVTLLGRYKFQDPDAVLGCPENQSLAERPHPHILEPGDTVAIPEQHLVERSCATDQMHRYDVVRLAPKLRLVLHDAQHEPLSPVLVEASIDGAAPKPATVEGEGEVSLDISPQTREVKLAVYLEGDEDDPSIEWTCRVGSLRRQESEAGLLGRLKNLGYYRPSVAPEREMVERRAAIEQFQIDQGLSVTQSLDQATVDRILEVYGC